MKLILTLGHCEIIVIERVDELLNERSCIPFLSSEPALVVSRQTGWIMIRNWFRNKHLGQRKE